MRGAYQRRGQRIVKGLPYPGLTMRGTLIKYPEMQKRARERKKNEHYTEPARSKTEKAYLKFRHEIQPENSPCVLPF